MKSDENTPKYGEDYGVDTAFDVETNSATDAADIRSTWNSENFRDILQLKSEIRRFKYYQFMIGYKFVIIIYLIALILQIGLWLILGGVEEAIYQANPVKTSRIFLLEGGMLVFDRGCSMSTTTVYIIGGVSIVYIIFEILALILCIRSDRDTYGIKRESLLLIIFQVICVVAFVICGLLDLVVMLTDYFIPYGYAVILYSFLDIIVSVVLPVCYSIRKDYQEKKGSKKEQETELTVILKNKKLFARFLEFSRRSFAPESVLCYRDIQHFK